MSIENVGSKDKKVIRVYAAGGGGTNIAKALESYRSGADGFAKLDTVYIDTSRSNLATEIPENRLYLIDGLDGSGKIRAENVEEISARTRDIVQKFKPADLNVVLATASGGSGSVIGPMLSGELLSREVPLIVVAIGSTGSKLEAENTLKTLKSYEGVARKAKTPIVVYYQQNSKETGRGTVDRIAQQIIVMFSALFSGENHEMDSRDLFNFLRYDRVTSYNDVYCAGLAILRQNDELPSVYGNVISVATLAASPDEAPFYIPPEYHTVGILPETISKEMIGPTPIHFVTTDGIIPAVAGELNKILQEMKETRHARISKPSLVDTNELDDDGMVL